MIEAGGARGEEACKTNLASQTDSSAGKNQVTMTFTLTDSAGSALKTETWARWQMGQVAAEPGASMCHKDAPVAMSITATIAAVTATRCIHRMLLLRVLIE